MDMILPKDCIHFFCFRLSHRPHSPLCSLFEKRFVLFYIIAIIISTIPHQHDEKHNIGNKCGKRKSTNNKTNKVASGTG